MVLGGKTRGFRRSREINFLHSSTSSTPAGKAEERERKRKNKQRSFKIKTFFSPAKHNNLETSQVNTYHQKNNYLKNSRSKTPNCLSFSHKQTLQKYKFK